MLFHATKFAVIFLRKSLKFYYKITSFNFGHTFLMNIWILRMYGKIMTINYNFQSKNRQVGIMRKALALGFLFMYFLSILF